MTSTPAHANPVNATAGPGPSSSRAGTPSHVPTGPSAADPPVKPELPWAFHDCPIDTLVVLISHMLDLLMQHNDQVQLTPDALTRFHSRAAPGISVLDYLRRIVKYTNMEKIPLLSLLAYIDLTCANLPTFTLSTLTVHRFLIAGVCAGSKAQCDVFCTNAHYAKVGGIKVQELNALEREFLRVTQWALCCNADLLQRYYTSLIRSHGGFTQLTAPHRSPFRAFPRSLSKPRSKETDQSMEQDEEQDGQGGGGSGESEADVDNEGDEPDEDQDMEGDGTSTHGSGSGSASASSSRPPSRPRSPDKRAEGQNATDERGRKARRRSVEEVLGVSPEVMGAGSVVGVRDKHAVRGTRTGERQQGEEDVDMEGPGDESGTGVGHPEDRMPRAETQGLALQVDPPTASTAKSAPLAIPTAHHRAAHSPTSPTLLDKARGNRSRHSSATPASSSLPSSRSSTRGNSLRRGSTASAASTTSRRSGRSSLGGAGVLGTSVGKTPSLSMSAGSAGRPAEAVLDTRHGQGGQGVKTPDVLGSRREREGVVKGYEGGEEGVLGQMEDLPARSGVTADEAQLGNTIEATRRSVPATVPSAVSATSPGPAGGASAQAPAHPHAHENGHAHAHAHPHLPSGGKLLKNLVGVFKKRSAHPHVSPAGSPEREQSQRATHATSAAGTVPIAPPTAHSQRSVERPAKSPRINHSHTSPSISPNTTTHMPLSSAPISTSTSMGMTRMSPQMLNGVNVNINLNLSPPLANTRAPSSRSPIMSHAPGQHTARQARARSTSTSKSKSRSPRNSPFLAPAPARPAGQGGTYGVRREEHGGLAT